MKKIRKANYKQLKKAHRRLGIIYWIFMFLGFVTWRGGLFFSSLDSITAGMLIIILSVTFALFQANLKTRMDIYRLHYSIFKQKQTTLRTQMILLDLTKALSDIVDIREEIKNECTRKDAKKDKKTRTKKLST